MWYRVVDVNQVKLFGSRHLEDLRGESVCIGRELEQRIAQHIHGVEMDSLASATFPQPHWRRIAYEVNLVPPLGKLQTQLGPDHAAPAV